MSLDRVRRALAERLDEGDRGDRGWFVITRVHVALSWLRGIAEYLENRSGGDAIHLTEQDYRRLATIIETDTHDPGVQLRRHHLLVMDKPLQLLRRLDGRQWSRIALTDLGRHLAITDDPATVLEQSLSAIQFAVEPWSPPDRVEQYNQFRLRVYDVMKQVLRNCDGYIDRDEFDFFVSRIRHDDEVAPAVAAIADYRALTPAEQASLHDEVRRRMPSAKTYSNWRDIGLHTFSLFSLGTAMVRNQTRLLFTSNWVGSHAVPVARVLRAASPKPPESASPDRSATRALRTPEPQDLGELLTPPTAAASNDGADAESFVAKVLRSQGWQVAFYTNRRGYGFDLWARRDDQAMVIEVKSSLAALGAVTLTRTEHQAATRHGDRYVLALVEHLSSDSPHLRMVRDPAAALRIEERQSSSYVIVRAEWLRAARGDR